jgi:hypothetical protein
MKISGTVDGLDSLSARLARIADPEELAETLGAAAEDVRHAALAQLHDAAPSDARRGNLATSLVVTPSADGSSVSVGTMAADGWHREFGSMARPAAPWLEPALEAARPGILARVALSLNRRIRAPGRTT